MDIKCVKCGEPWDYFGIHNGDMGKWELELFKKGSGCPCCEGEGSWEPTSVFDLENGDDDPVLRLNAWEDAQAGKVPNWEQPASEVLWTCAGCGVRVEKDSEGELEYVVPLGSKASSWHISHSFWKNDPAEEPAHTFGEDPVCEHCLKNCVECNTELSSTLEFGDVYDDGYSVLVNHDHYCIDCYSALLHTED